MALDVTKTILDAVWAAFEGRTAFTSAVKPGNRVKTSEVAYLSRLNSRTAPADYPCVFTFPTGGSTSTPAKTFGTGASVSTFNHPVSRIVTFDVRLVHDALHDSLSLALEAEIDAALESLNEATRNETLRASPATPRHTRTNKIIAGVQRTESTWNLTIECRPYRSTLIS